MRARTECATFSHTCGNICVKYSAILQGSRVPAAHCVAFLWKVCLVALFQHRLGVLGRTLRKAMQAHFVTVVKKTNKNMSTCWSSTSSTTSALTSFDFSSILTALTCSVTSSIGSVPLNLCGGNEEQIRLLTIESFGSLVEK